MEKETKKPEWYYAVEVELVYKTKVKASQRPQITSVEDTYNLLRQIWKAEKIELVEEFKVLLLNRSNRVLGVFDVSSGGVTMTVADPKIILAAAVKCNAVNIIQAHNHPSGSLKPSRADEDLTRKIKEAARYMDMNVIDHVIITAEDFFSFANEGLL